MLGAGLLLVPLRGSAQAVASLGGEHRCELLDGQVRCEGWERRERCEVARGMFEIQLPEAATAIASGDALSCALTASHAVYCWGWTERSCCGAGTCPAPELTPREIIGVRGRAVALDAGGRVACVVLDDGTATCWGENLQGELGRGTNTQPHGELVPAPATPTDVQPVVSSAGVLGELVSIVVDSAGACAIDASHAVWCWGGLAVGQPDCTRGVCPPAQRVSLGVPASRLRCGYGGCCALDDARRVECWGPASTTVAELVRDVPGWIDLVIFDEDACIATAQRVECTGGMRPERDRPWSGFRTRHGQQIVALDAHVSGVCATTSGSPLCWGSERGPTAPVGVAATIAATHWRLTRGERALRTRVEPIACGEATFDDGSVEATLSARARGPTLRVEVHDLLYNCGHVPTIDARLRADGSIELGIGVPPAGVVSARCECRHDLVVTIQGAPAGERDVTFETDDAEDPPRAHVRLR